MSSSQWTCHLAMSGHFAREKQCQLTSQDLSRKGAIDEPILDLVSVLNDDTRFYTTSSCSGRIVIYSLAEGSEANHKKGCRWLFVSHQPVSDYKLILDAVADNSVSEAHFKLEPFVMHVCCDGVENAKKLHTLALESGFRNSGLTISKTGRVMLAIRSTHSLQLPVLSDSQLLVTEQYIDFLIQLANKKLCQNLDRVDKFYCKVKDFLNKTSE